MVGFVLCDFEYDLVGEGVVVYCDVEWPGLITVSSLGINGARVDYSVFPRDQRGVWGHHSGLIALPRLYRTGLNAHMRLMMSQGLIWPLDSGTLGREGFYWSTPNNGSHKTGGTVWVLKWLEIPEISLNWKATCIWKQETTHPFKKKKNVLNFLLPVWKGTLSSLICLQQQMTIWCRQLWIYIIVMQNVSDVNVGPLYHYEEKQPEVWQAGIDICFV